jgi:hypothetical protein
MTNTPYIICNKSAEKSRSIERRAGGESRDKYRRFDIEYLHVAMRIADSMMYRGAFDRPQREFYTIPPWAV